MNLYILRHGETDLNLQHRLQGRLNTRLNDNGRTQAEDIFNMFRKKNIEFDKVYSSPLDRAVETAKVSSGFNEEDLIKEEHLLEMDFGPAEGVVYESLSNELRSYIDDPWSNPEVEGIETAEKIISRVSDFLNIIKDDDAENILAVTHGMAMHALLTALPGRGREMWSEPLGNCTVYMTTYEDGIYSQPVRLTEMRPTFR